MKNKLTIKLITIIVLSITLLSCIIAPIYINLYPKLYIKQEIDYVAQYSEKLKAVEPFDNEHITQFVEDSPESFRIYVFDENFEPLYTSYTFSSNKKFLEKLFSTKMSDFKEDSTPYYVDVDNDPSVRLSTCCEKNGKVYYIYIKDSHSGVIAVFDFVNKIFVWIIGIFTLLCSILVICIIAPTVKSIKKVTDVATSISENNLSVRYQGKIYKNEIGDLAHSVNKMADTIQENIEDLENYNFVLNEDNRNMLEREQAFRMLLCNTTHDLKTPLAVISSQVEMISTCKEQEKKDYYYNSAMEEIDKMSKTITNMLNMTRDDSRLMSKKTELIDISMLINNLCNGHNAYVKSYGLKPKRDITPDLKINTISEYIGFVFRNYVSNAAQNASKNTEITVSLKEHGDAIRLSVENHGSSISDDIKDKIWTESFTTSPKGKENTGLGLYIVKKISMIENTQCGFFNTENGVCFWFDFIDCPDKSDDIEQ